MTLVRAHARTADSARLARGLILIVAFVMVLAWPVPSANAAPPEVSAQVEFVVGSEVAHDYLPEIPWGSASAQGVLIVDLGGFEPPATWSVMDWYAGMAPEERAAGSIGAYGVDMTIAMQTGFTDYDDDFGGHTAWTNRRWSRMTLTATVSEGQVIAIVMPMAENRGEARIKLDGVKAADVDTYAEGPRQHRIVMWQTGPLTAGEHTIEVINLGTEGHPRIDVDAFMIAG